MMFFYPYTVCDSINISGLIIKSALSELRLIINTKGLGRAEMVVGPRNPPGGVEQLGTLPSLVR